MRAWILVSMTLGLYLETTLAVASGQVLTMSPNSLVFGGQAVQTTSAPQTVNLKNRGTAVLTITKISLGGANPSQFAQSNNCSASVAAGSSCTFNVTFKPSNMYTSTKTGTLYVYGSAPSPIGSVALTGQTVSIAVGISLTPSSTSLGPAGRQQFSATVTGTSNTVATWSVSPAVGSISTAGLYTAPSSITSSQTVTVTATSAADPTKSAHATVNLIPPVSINVSPASVTLRPSQTQAFSATVANTGNTAATWSLSPTVGSITAAGLYTAPASITSSQTVTVTATSAADTSKSASATVTLTPPVTVSLAPSSVSLQPSQKPDTYRYSRRNHQHRSHMVV